MNSQKSYEYFINACHYYSVIRSVNRYVKLFSEKFLVQKFVKFFNFLITVLVLDLKELRICQQFGRFY